MTLHKQDQGDKSTWMEEDLLFPLAHPKLDEEMRNYEDDFFEREKRWEFEEEFLDRALL